MNNRRGKEKKKQSSDLFLVLGLFGETLDHLNIH